MLWVLGGMGMACLRTHETLSRVPGPRLDGVMAVLVARSQSNRCCLARPKPGRVTIRLNWARPCDRSDGSPYEAHRQFLADSICTSRQEVVQAFSHLALSPNSSKIYHPFACPLVQSPQAMNSPPIRLTVTLMPREI